MLVRRKTLALADTPSFDPSLIEGDAAHVDLADASADLIVSNLGINNFENPDAVLAECFRLAKPGATLALTTNVVGHMQEFYDVYRSTLAELGLREELTGLEAHVRHRGTAESVPSLLERVGFRVTEPILQDALRRSSRCVSRMARPCFGIV